jgi:acyl phosphate:glycerol-3-phosphate acyltransferase
MSFLITLSISYLIGSIPTAYLFLKFSHGIDIRETGSRNVGAMNSFEITKSKRIGIFIFIIDFLKGAVPVLTARLMAEDSFVLCASALCTAVLAHCYSPWIGFKGGKGLATAAGGALFIFPLILLGWLLTWVVFYRLKKNIDVANFLTTLFIWIFSIIFVRLFSIYSFVPLLRENDFRIPVSVMLLIILSRHIGPVWGTLKSK